MHYSKPWVFLPLALLRARKHLGLVFEVGYFELLEQYYHKYSQLGKVSIIGDLNSRCGHKSDIIINTDDYDRFIPVIDSHVDENLTFNLPERFSQDNVCNSSGQKLLDLCHSSDLRIVNGRIGDDAHRDF